MKMLIALLLSATILLTGCASSVVEGQSSSETSSSTTSSITEASTSSTESTAEPLDNYEFDVNNFKGLDDPNLHQYIEDSVYAELVNKLDSDDYFVENVAATYVSQEYLDEVAFNSQSNIYFGYTLAELNNMFEGKRYVFTLGDDGKTAVQELAEITDNDNETILKDVAIGTGVILICVTVSLVTGGAGAPAASAIFAVAAKTGAIAAVSSAALGGVSAGVVRGIETGDMNEALEASALGASEGYKWGAISGAISGGAGEAIALKGATLSGLTMNEAALVQKQSKYPLDVIKQFHSFDEFLVYKNAGLKAVRVNGKVALMPDIDLNYVSTLPDGTKVTNLVRMQSGKPPIDPVSEKVYQLHHIGQKSNGTLAVLTEAQHQGNSKILNIPGKVSEIDRPEFDKTRKEFWEYAGNVLFSNRGV